MRNIQIGNFKIGNAQIGNIKLGNAEIGRMEWPFSATIAPICAHKVRNMVQPVPTKAVLQTAKAVAMCTACFEYACPPPPIHFFASAKPIFKMDCAN